MKKELKVIKKKKHILDALKRNGIEAVAISDTETEYGAISTSADARKLADLGINRITTNRPAQMARVLERDPNEGRAPVSVATG